MISQIAAAEWMNALEESAREVALTALGFSECTTERDCGAPPPELFGAYLPLGTTFQPVQIGLLSGERGCQALAKALLGLTPLDDDLPLPDVGDAVSEVLNMLAGGLKRRLAGRLELKLGLPLFLHGTVQSNAHVTLMPAKLVFGSVDVFVVFASAKPMRLAL